MSSGVFINEIMEKSHAFLFAPFFSEVHLAIVS